MPYRLDGVRVYAVKGNKSKNRHGRQTYSTRAAALKALGRRGPRDHSRKLMANGMRATTAGKAKRVIA